MNSFAILTTIAMTAIGLMACTSNQSNQLNDTGYKCAVFASVITCASTQSGTTSEQHSVWDNTYGGADKSYDVQLLKMREEVAPKFQTLAFTDPVTGEVMDYNLFVPKNYDPKQSYPLVLFMADASTTGKGAMAPLKQGYGGIIWATDESQSKNPSFVLVPAFKGDKNATGMNAVVNDQWQASAEVETALRLLHHVVGQYSIDKKRLYTTGQSMGGMVSFYLNAKHPDLFAASIFVGSQWDIKVLEPLARMKFFYIVSKGDEKASGGMKQVGDMLTRKGVAFSHTEFAANLPQVEKNQAVKKLISQNKNINFVQFTAGTVAPKEFLKGGGAEHMYSFDHAYLLSDVRQWLFQQSKKDTPERITRDYARVATEQGLAYMNGTGAVQDYAKALDFFVQGALLDDMKASRYVGMMYEEGLGVDVNYSIALRYYNFASELGDITAAAKIGSLYERGLGVMQSYPKAIKWYRKAAPSPEIAATNIHPRVLALSRLGYLYEHGLGVTKDIAQAKIWYELAAQDNDANALAALQRLSHAIVID